MKTPEQTKQEAKAAFERGNSYYEKKEYDLAIKEYSETIRLDHDFTLAHLNRRRAYIAKDSFHLPDEPSQYIFIDRQDDSQEKCSFCGLPACLAHGLMNLENDKSICGKCINKNEIMEQLKRDNEKLYKKILEETLGNLGLENNRCFISDDIMNLFSINAKWLPNLTIEGLRTRAREYEKPNPPEAIIINNIPIHKNLSAELLEGEIFKKNNEKDIEVSNLGRIRYDDHILEQYDPQNNGYLFVNIKTKGETILEKVYRLVAETWLERPDPKELPKDIKYLRYNTVHHISNNGYDNRIENLMWVTEWQHAMIHPWISIGTFDYEELGALFASYADINITPVDYQRIINIAKGMQQLENAESKSPGKYDYWYANIIGAMEDLTSIQAEVTEDGILNLEDPGAADILAQQMFKGLKQHGML
jgi:ribosomal protein L24E